MKQLKDFLNKIDWGWRLFSISYSDWETAMVVQNLEDGELSKFFFDYLGYYEPDPWTNSES